MIKKIAFSTDDRQTWVNLSDKIKDFIDQSGVKEGLCLVYNPHTTGGLFINSYLDPNTPKDILHEYDRLIPTRYDFYHQFDTPSDAAGHVKSTLMNVALTLIIHEGQLVLGHSQGVIFCEFDGPRDRNVIVKILPDCA
ncbi:YjbQ family protein [bacterium]|nr:MAG: YjbQ family protein [bacterium]